MNAFWKGERSRKIIKRLIVEAQLTLLTPAHLGNGDSDDLTDMPLFVAPDDGKTPLLSGASLAGALRSYLRERENGFGQQDHKNSLAVSLFGGLPEDPDGEQSLLIVDDTYGTSSGVTIRDGVQLDGASRTAADSKKFDAQLWEAGTSFPLRFELLICSGPHLDDYQDNHQDQEARLCQALLTALYGFNDPISAITLGARKRRGYGRVEAKDWRLRLFDLQSAQGLRDWITQGPQKLSGVALSFEDLQKQLGVAQWGEDRREIFEIKAHFLLDGSILIRSGGEWQDKGPDAVHLRARQYDGKGHDARDPVLPGTSLGGVLRARARKITNTLLTNGPPNSQSNGQPNNQPNSQPNSQLNSQPNSQLNSQPNSQTNGQPNCQTNGADLIADLFGETNHASRLEVWEDVIRGGTTELVQNRVSLDRFTGGTRAGALFNQQPVFGNDQTQLTITCRLRVEHDQSAVAEIGLLLYLLKDLWTGDFPLGGESGVGRGRLKGHSAHLTWRRPAEHKTWAIEAAGADLTVRGSIRRDGQSVDQSSTKAREELESFASAFGKLLQSPDKEETAKEETDKEGKAEVSCVTRN